MKILGFGDSFILGHEACPRLEDIHPDSDWTHKRGLHSECIHPWRKSYQGMIGNHFQCIPEFRGVAGTGPWNMFFDFMKRKGKRPSLYSLQDVDVIIMAWSEITRIYHPKYKPINTGTIYNKSLWDTMSEEEKKVTTAAKIYLEELMDLEQKSYELTALMTLVDQISAEFPKIKFIHLPCFAKDNPGEWWGAYYNTKKPNELNYHHNFKNGMEIRPALMWMSMLDEWPTDLSKDRRECHMTPRVNRLLADSIIHCIENYQPGKIIDMDVSLIK